MVKMKIGLPNIHRKSLTVDSSGYRDSVRDEIGFRKTLNQTGKGSQNNLEILMRLQSVYDGINGVTDRFKISEFSGYDKQSLKFNNWMAEDSKAVLIYLNGLESHAGWFSEIANNLADKGVTTYGLDRRGSGLNSSKAGKYQDWVDDVDAIIKLAKKQNPGCPVNLSSLCFGAKVASAYAIQKPEEVDSLVYLSPGLNLKVDPSVIEKLKIALNFIPGVSLNIPSPIKEDKMFTDSEDYLDFLRSDKLRTAAPRASDFWEARKITDYVLKNLGKIKIPTKVFLAEKDKIVNNVETRKIFDEFGVDAEIIEVMNSEHTLFFGEHKNKLISGITEFIRTK